MRDAPDILTKWLCLLMTARFSSERMHFSDDGDASLVSRMMSYQADSKSGSYYKILQSQTLFLETQVFDPMTAHSATM